MRMLKPTFACFVIIAVISGAACTSEDTPDSSNNDQGGANGDGDGDGDQERDTIQGEDPSERVAGGEGGTYSMVGQTTGSNPELGGMGGRGDSEDATTSGEPTDGSETRGPDGDLVIQLVAGSGHFCALTAANEVKCWGSNYYGQSGGPSVAVQVVGATKIEAPHGDTRAIYAGSDLTCLVGDDEVPRCFGRNLGLTSPTWDDTRTLDPTPLDGHDEPSVDIDIYSEHGCLVTQVGGIRCWGRDSFGGETWSQTPTVLNVAEMGSGFSKVAVGEGDLQISAPNGGYEFGCGLLETGKVRCWGFNSFGVLGFGVDDGQSVHDAYPPIDVINLDDAIDIDAGRDFVCALTSEGVVKCWGDEAVIGTGANDRDLAGEGSPYDPFSDPSPMDVLGDMGRATALACGQHHACAIAGEESSVYCWGHNIYGEVGVTTDDGLRTMDALEATEVPGTEGATLIAAGIFNTCAAMKLGGVKCWGSDAQIGGTSEKILRPVALDGF